MNIRLLLLFLETSPSTMSLPALQPKMSAQSFPPPRRYEETKPAQMQYLTHRQIVGEKMLCQIAC